MAEHSSGARSIAGGRVAEMVAGAVAFSADYPKAGEHPFSQALEAATRCWSVCGAQPALLSQKTARPFVAGEEAGGNPAAGLAMVTRGRRGPPLAGQILLSPMLDAGMATCSMRTAEARSVGCKWADGWHDYLGSPDKGFHPYAEW
jgi:acetyl esterase/lipase